ncbi:aldo/keto reductase family oxidoreductase [Thalassotalea sp. PS06]|uniref:aldo/keto reductase n=1 Tax=Thalassotalea sp. PS06 TaxID=2594005 RepID=UPI00116260E1|nr:aldo/keto reductase [Thalassotalea sp. PS06]QDP02707.1 aldo/keto reductase [Thalassotalea sp. PS06]
MKTLTIPQLPMPSSRLIYGCMRISGDNSQQDREKGKRAIEAAIDEGYNHFDHADIYGGGECESIFGEVLKAQPHLRNKVLITSKAGIRFANTPVAGEVGRYDFSHNYLIKQVEGSLKRLNVDALDMFLLHRPDYLFNAEDVAHTLNELRQSGKVKHFGVSNFSASQLELLQSKMTDSLLVNQIEINIHNIDAFSNGTLDQCQQYGITPMAWCPIATVAYEAWGNTFSDEDVARIQQEYQRQADFYGCEQWVIALAWLLINPAQICPIIGSTNPERITMAKQALDLDYRHEDWYRLLEARNGHPVP